MDERRILEKINLSLSAPAVAQNFNILSLPELLGKLQKSI